MEDLLKDLDIDFLFEMYHKGLSIKDISNWEGDEGERSKFAKEQLLVKKTPITNIKFDHITFSENIFCRSVIS